MEFLPIKFFLIPVSETLAISHANRKVSPASKLSSAKKYVRIEIGKRGRGTRERYSAGTFDLHEGGGRR
jgi:hypothetical protein